MLSRMCLVAVAWRAHARFPLVLAGNRDEFHARPTAPAAWWEDAAHVLGGRDLVAGGSWLAVSRAGRLAVIVNDPRRPPGPERQASRGHLVRDYVAGEKPSGRYLDAVAVNESRYAGFLMVLGTPVQLRGFATSKAGAPHRWTLKPGVAAFSNSPLESPWPKVGWLETTVRHALADPDAGPGALAESLFAALGRREPATAGPPEHPAAHTPFLADERYGTRASTVITIDADGRCRFEERRYAAGGAPAGRTVEAFTLAG
jgi:uncharacterized protein with NRDE domain